MGNRSVSVDGSNTKTFKVIPNIDSISPAQGPVGQNIQVTISGAGFSGSNLSVQAGAGITVTINTSSATEIQATFAIAANAAVGPRSVTVTANGQTSFAFGFAVQSCAIPVNFRKVSALGLTDGTLRVTYDWDSSSGDKAHLAACAIAEIVFYPGSGSSFTWPFPMVATTLNPTSRSGPGNTIFVDNHFPPDSFSQPFMFASFDANQFYRFVCGCHNGGNPVDLATFTITSQ